MRSAVVLLAIAFAVPAQAQKPADHVALGVAAQQQLKPSEALQHYQAALTTDSLNYEANWRGATAAIEVAQLPSSATTTLSAPTHAPAASPAPAANTPADSAAGGAGAEPEPEAESQGEPQAAPARTLADSMYILAEAYARRSLTIDDRSAPGHFAVAFVLGSRSMVSDPLTKLSMAREIWEESSRAIEIDQKNDGAYHILGEWYAQIMRLSSFERGYATGELGEIAEQATWDLAFKNLEKAAELAPSLIYHHLDLARAYADGGRPDDAKKQIAKIETLSATYSRDPEYKAAAKALLEHINGAGKQP